MPDLFAEKFKNLVPTYLEEPWTPAEGIAPEKLQSLLDEAGVKIPQAMREFYLTLGECPEFMEAFHYFWDPDELEVDDSAVLMFLEDEAEENTWGIRTMDVALPDPIVYRKNNARGDWITEDGTFTEFMFDMFQWIYEDED